MRLAIIVGVMSMCLSLDPSTVGSQGPPVDNKKLVTAAAIQAKLRDINVPTSKPDTYDYLVGDLIRLVVATKDIDPATVSTALEPDKGDALRRVALVIETVSGVEAYVAYYVADKVGTATVDFTYNKTTKRIAFKINRPGFGQVVAVDIDNPGSGLIEANPGDLIRFTTKAHYDAGIIPTPQPGQDVVKLATVLNDPASKTLTAVFSVEKAGTTSLAISWGESGVIFRVESTAFIVPARNKKEEPSTSK